MLSNIWRNQEKIRYLVIGVWNTAFAYLAFGIIYYCFHENVHYLVVSAIAHFVAVANAFACQRWLVFHSTTHWWGSYLRFNLVNLVVLAFSLASITILVEVLHWSPLASQITVMIASVVGGYFLNRNVSFRVPIDGN